MNKKQYLSIAKQLFITDWKVFLQHATSKCIALIIWGSCQLIVGAYFLPKLGITHSYGIIALAGILAVAGFMDAYGNVVELIVDLETDKITYYYATLPLPMWVVFFEKIIAMASFSIILTLSFIPIGFLLTWHVTSPLEVNWLLVIIAMFFGNIFYGAFTLFIASFVKSRQHIGSLWRSFIFPLWFLGGFGFTWLIIYEVSPIFAYIELLNPIIYISEAYRVAFLGQVGMINFWVCIGAIIVFTITTGWIGIKRLKKRCDFI
jgi:ABC-2 type transport system permease protein